MERDDEAWWRLIDAADGLRLRAPNHQDADGVRAVHSDPRVYRLDPHEVHADLEQSRRFLAPILEHWTTQGFGYWTVLGPRAWHPEGAEDRSVDRPGGGERRRVHLGLGGIQRHVIAGVPALNVYFRLAPAVHGRGIAGRVLARGVELAAAVAPGVDVVVRTRPANAAARQVAIRAGFLDEGFEPGTTDMQLLRLPAAAVPRR